MTRFRMAGAAAVAFSLLAGCAQYTAMPRPGYESRGTEDMSSDQMMQTDFNRTLTIAMRDNLSSLMALMTKLYKRNPREWRKSGKPSMEVAAETVRRSIDARTPPAGLQGLGDVEILAVSLDPAYTGDRVAAFIYGMADTIVAAHDGKTRFYAFDLLDGGRVYNAARNVEAAAWLLGTRRDAKGEPLLLANEWTDKQVNLSFEREFGAVIGRLDLIANLLGENSRRLGINYAQNLMLFSFLPVR
ncbi:hypothetical protein [Pigmentiphaga sp.]|uniref:hypothetical protein n=1 Tax=Pigmentiphaga sp. TaxID=1977564 RepID=UPI00128D7DE7|nr:hypothetical protein [Pigmentiphaga sp.]MPS26259.1 hypothetical protein [Alcaligenaceae bacterium SAGV5]MPS53233.1 hypothetical protein [Alcaligenaceae bacterium SAGV3]MPT57711.1 hypothetical protein [Alcaligenaceae bacterium]